MKKQLTILLLSSSMFLAGCGSYDNGNIKESNGLGSVSAYTANTIPNYDHNKSKYWNVIELKEFVPTHDQEVTQKHIDQLFDQLRADMPMLKQYAKYKDSQDSAGMSLAKAAFGFAHSGVLGAGIETDYYKSEEKQPDYIQLLNRNPWLNDNKPAAHIVMKKAMNVGRLSKHDTLKSVLNVEAVINNNIEHFVKDIKGTSEDKFYGNYPFDFAIIDRKIELPIIPNSK